jgi:uncharacterized protein (PEP-CTERM system associated)
VAHGKRCRFRVIATPYAWALGLMTSLTSLPSLAENWVIIPRLELRESYTSNANLAQEGQQESSFITTVTPGIGINGNGARVKLNGNAALQGQIYKGERRDNELFAQADLIGSVEAIERFFFIEAAVNVNQRYISPFGPQPVGTLGATDNRYTSATYRMSPYLRGTTRSGVNYSLRSDQVWTQLVDTPDTPGLSDSAYFHQWLGRIDGPIGARFDWAADANALYSKFPDQRVQSNELLRGTLGLRLDPQFRVFGTGGYEWNNYLLTPTGNTIYGGGAEWRPSERSDVRGQWEHRFFGSSYLATINHRNPFTAFNVTASRNSSTYPQQLLSLPAGGNVAALIDAAFTTRIPDPTQRAAAVQAFLNQTGLPAVLQSPLNFYTQQVTLVEQQSATATLLGVRNALALTVFKNKSTVLPGDQAVQALSVLGVFENNRQRGVSLSYSHRLSGLTSANAIVSRFETTALEPASGKSTGDFFQLSSITRLGPKTDGMVGANYTIFDSNISTDYDAFTAYVAVSHRF